MMSETKTLHNSLSLTYFYSSYRSIFPMLNHKKANTHIPLIHKHMMYLYYLLIVHIYLYNIIVGTLLTVCILF